MRWFGRPGDAAIRETVIPLTGAPALASGGVPAASGEAVRDRLYRLTECVPPSVSAGWLSPAPAPAPGSPRHQ